MVVDKKCLRIAIACSGLGHTRRGIESWAQDLAEAIRRRGLPVTLFGGAPGHGIDALPCLKRTDPCAKRVVRWFRRLSGWRYGLGASYDVEQVTFSFFLWRRVRRDFDVLHVQDPIVGRILDTLQRLGLSRAHVILANGTDERIDRLSHLSVVQELSPEAAKRWDGRKAARSRIFTIPNFINTSTFQLGDRYKSRDRFELPKDTFIVLCCAAIRRVHKRIDYLLREFSNFSERYGAPVMLVIAGAREQDTDELVELGRQALGDRVRFFVDLPRSDMPDIYRAADVFTLTSLSETFGIVLLEAMSAGVPVICNNTSTFRYVAGPAGEFSDMQREGALADTIMHMASSERREPLRRAARAHVEATFSEEIVVDQILDMYRRVVHG